jgi:hypothetical protein
VFVGVDKYYFGILRPLLGAAQRIANVLGVVSEEIPVDIIWCMSRPDFDSDCFPKLSSPTDLRDISVQT